MAYAKRYVGGFLDLPNTTTPIDSAFLNALETSMLKLQAVDPSADAQVLQYDNANSRFAPALLLNKNVDPAAAIAKTKLDFTGANGIVNADVAGAAAIALSKLATTGTIGTSPISIAAAGKTALQIADSGAQSSGITIGGDTNLYRSAAGVLKTDGQLQAVGEILSLKTTGYSYYANQPAANIVLQNFLLSADANPAIKLGGDGKLSWGPGGASALDTNLYRATNDTLATDDRLAIVRQANGDIWLQFSVSGQTQEQFRMTSAAAGPILNFGPGTGATDTNLYRSAAGFGKSDHEWQIVGGVATKVKAGAPVDGDFASAVDGLIVADTTNNKIWARVGGVWKGVVIA